MTVAKEQKKNVYRAVFSFSIAVFLDVFAFLQYHFVLCFSRCLEGIQTNTWLADTWLAHHGNTYVQGVSSHFVFFPFRLLTIRLLPFRLIFSS